MKLRTKLILALFFLAIVPLLAIVLYSYYSSLGAFRKAVEAESRQQTEGMNERMKKVREDLDHFLGRATDYRFADFNANGQLHSRENVGDELFLREAEELSSLVENCEFIPAGCEDIEAPLHSIPATPAIEVPARNRMVFKADWFCPDITSPKPLKLNTSTDDVSTGEAPPPDPTQAEIVNLLVSGGAKMLAQAIEDPEQFEEDMSALAEHSDEIAQHVMNIVVKEGAEIIANTMDDPEALEVIMNIQSDRIREVVLSKIPSRLRLTENELSELEERRKMAESVIGREYKYEVWDSGEVVGHMRAGINTSDVLDAVLKEAQRDEGEVPFAIGADGVIYTLDPKDKTIVDELDIARAGAEATHADNWIVAETIDPVSGTTFGIARPLGSGLDEIRQTAVYNMAFGMVLIGLAGFGILPLSQRMTRHLKTLTRAAETLASGDLSTRVPVRSRDEFGILAGAFNKMAEDLEEHEIRIVEQERAHHEQEIENRILDRENLRRKNELEAARQFQLSLLPAFLPCCKSYDIAVSTRTATEVGGDYYDFRETHDGTTVVALGDATGHGAAAGTMVTAAKSLFTASTELEPQLFLNRATSVFRTMRLGRMAMAMAIAHLQEDGLRVSMAGMPPLMVHRSATNEVEEFVVPGLPLGSFKDATYREIHIPLQSGDTVLMMSDGFPELLDQNDDPLGYKRALAMFEEVGTQEPAQIIKELEARSDAYRGACPQADDMTFVVLKKT